MSLKVGQTIYQTMQTEAHEILDKIFQCYNNSMYEDLLKELADKLLDEKYLEEENKVEKVGTIYECDGKFQFVDKYEEDEEDDYWGDEEEDEEDY